MPLYSTRSTFMPLVALMKIYANLALAFQACPELLLVDHFHIKIFVVLRKT